MRSFDFPEVRTFTKHFLILDLLPPKTLPLDSAFPIQLVQGVMREFHRRMELGAPVTEPTWPLPGRVQASLPD